jgi:hypothetical protein
MGSRFYQLSPVLDTAVALQGFVNGVNAFLDHEKMAEKGSMSRPQPHESSDIEMPTVFMIAGSNLSNRVQPVI